MGTEAMVEVSAPREEQLDLADIQAARARIAGRIRLTPVEGSAA